MRREDQSTEFKEAYVDDIKKTVVAFANTDGGTVFVGVDDSGRVVGVDDVDRTILRAQNALRDAIKPDVTMHVSCSAREVESKTIIAIEVQKGTSRPYYLADKGIRPAGVYVRQGPSSVPASEAAILQMIREADGGSYESARSLEQSLSFSEAETAFEEAGLTFGEGKRRTLGLVTEDGVRTNLALLLSDQCPHTVKLAVFQGRKKSVFRDRCELSGSVLRQLDGAYEYINRFNRLRSEFKGLKRIDMPDYPEEAIREALLNTIVHRDYALSGPALISIFDDRIEFVTLGGLVKGVSADDIALGISIPRNKRLAEVFYRLKLIEAYGTGIPKINECYDGTGKHPVIQTTPNAFKVTLPNLNYDGVDRPELNGLTDSEKRAYRLFESNPVVKRSDIEQSLGVSQTMAIRILSHLGDKGLIRREGAGRSTRYRRAETS